MDKELISIIDRLVEERTLSVEGVKGIEHLRQKAEGMEARLASQCDTIRDLRTEVAALASQRDSLRAREEEAQKSRSELAAREAKIFEHEKARAVAEARAEEVRMAMGTIFRPNSVRERWTSQVPFERTYSGGGNYVETHTETKDVVREEGV